jgi:D-beta-D-heptose 7-phosphate kinase/D-beta-D-heptose 1-phosphate adenosyltransferase
MREPREKILSRSALKKEIDRLRSEGRKIAFTNGCFDILHVGHVRYLREAAKTGDVMILALNSDASVRALKGDRRPLVPEAERADVAASLECVDYVNIFDELTPIELIALLQPDVIVKGGDWAAENVVGRDAVKQWGGAVVIVPQVPGVSTTNIIDKILNVYSKI